MINFQYLRTSSAKAALSLAAKDKKAVYIAGGTNLVDLMKRGVTAPEKLIDINPVPLKAIALVGNVLHIGALASNAAVADDSIVKTNFPLLAMALNAGASAQLRNMATVGGNMMQRTRCGYFYDISMPCNKRVPGTGCAAIGGYNRMHAIFGTSAECIAVHPSDMCVALVAFNAVVVVLTAKGERRVNFIDFHKLASTTPEKDNTLQAGELILRLEVPVNDLAANSYYLKVRDRASYAFALVSVAAAVNIVDGKIENCRLAMGGVAHKPWRLTAAEAYLNGKAPSVSNFTEAAKIAMEGAQGYGKNNFKLKMAPNTIVEALTLATAKV